MSQNLYHCFVSGLGLCVGEGLVIHCFVHCRVYICVWHRTEFGKHSKSPPPTSSCTPSHKIIEESAWIHIGLGFHVGYWRPKPPKAGFSNKQSLWDCDHGAIQSFVTFVTACQLVGVVEINLAKIRSRVSLTEEPLGTLWTLIFTW